MDEPRPLSASNAEVQEALSVLRTDGGAIATGAPSALRLCRMIEALCVENARLRVLLRNLLQERYSKPVEEIGDEDLTAAEWQARAALGVSDDGH